MYEVASLMPSACIYSVLESGLNPNLDQKSNAGAFLVLTFNMRWEKPRLFREDAT